MRKKILSYIVIGLVILLVIPVSIAQAEPPEDAFKVDLIADGGNDGMKYDAGDILIWIENEYIFVNIIANDDWLFTETHVHIDSSGLFDDGIDDIPTNKPGSPKIGRFELKEDHDPALTDFIYSEFIGEIEDGHQFFIAVQAVVISETKGMESAWCDGILFREKGSWAMYVEFTDLDELTAELGMDLFYSRDPLYYDLWGSASGGVAPYTYSWDLDDDGIFDDAYGDEITIDALTLWQPDSYNPIGFRVEDSNGNIAFDTGIAYLLDLT